MTLFYLFDDRLNGSIPAELRNLHKPYQLVPNDNKLSGRVPAESGDMEGLTESMLGDSQLWFAYQPSILTPKPVSGV